MSECEGFEIAIEMRRYGAAERQASERLDAHLATCEACRRFEIEGKSAEGTMKERGAALDKAFDDATLRRGIRHAMDRSWRTPAVVAAALTSVVAVFAMAFRMEKGHVEYSNLRSMILLFATLLGLVVLRSVQSALGLWWSERHGKSLLPSLRADVTRRIRATVFVSVAMGALAVFFLALWPFASFGLRADLTWKALPAITLLGGLLGGAFYGFRVSLPRLRRERAELA